MDEAGRRAVAQLLSKALAHETSLRESALALGRATSAYRRAHPEALHEIALLDEACTAAGDAVDAMRPLITHAQEAIAAYDRVHGTATDPADG